MWALVSWGFSSPWGPLPQPPQAARLEHTALNKAPTEMESKPLPRPSHRLRGELISLGCIIQYLAIRSLSVTPEICSCRKLTCFPNAFLTCPEVTFSLPPSQKEKTPAA